MIKKIISILLVIIWMIFIFLGSNDNGKESQSKSGFVTSFIVEIFTNLDKNDPKFKEYEEKISFPIRKLAHFTEYFILAMLVMNMLTSFNINKYSLLICGLICLLYAISDEVHQLFSDGRSCQISDILLDTSASLIASYIYYKFKMRGIYEISK